MHRIALLLALIVLVAGCARIPDPNDPAEVGLMQPEVIHRNLKWASDAANLRVAEGEISEEEAKALVSQYADELLKSVDLDKIQPIEAWEYADVFRTARRWKEAEELFRIAVENARNNDRRVNDSLRLAHVLAEQGKVDEAIKTARSVFDVPAEDSAPILLAVYLEIVPAAKRQKDSEPLDLAKLIEDAIEIHQQTIVNGNTEAGKMFLASREHHIRSAWSQVVQLYRDAGREDLAQAALKRSTQAALQRIRV